MNKVYAQTLMVAINKTQTRKRGRRRERENIQFIHGAIVESKQLFLVLLDEH